MFLLCHFKTDMALKSLLNFKQMMIFKGTSILEGHKRDMRMTSDITHSTIGELLPVYN